MTQYFSHFLLSIHFALGLILFSFLGVVLIVVNTSPVNLGPSGMLLAFGSFYALFFALFLGAAHVASAFRRRFDEAGEGSHLLTRRSVMLASVWAFAPLILIALQSIGQLYIASIGLVLLFELLVSFYIIKA